MPSSPDALPSPRPRLFISAVSSEFGTLRGKVAGVADFLGYDVVSMDRWPTSYGELLERHRKQIDPCEGLIHITGIAYGSEPETHAPAAAHLPGDTPRFSHTQYEFLYAQTKGLKTWLIMPGPGCEPDTDADHLDLPKDPAISDAAAYQNERRRLQAGWIAYLKAQNHIRHEPQDDRDVELMIHRLRDHAEEMRGKFHAWQDFITAHLEEAVSLLKDVKEDTATIAARMSEVQKALAEIQQQQRASGAAAPLSDWPREELEKALARQIDIELEELRAILAAGRISLDALVAGQALLASGKRDEAGAKFDEVILHEKAAMERLRQAHTGKGQIALDEADYKAALNYYRSAAALVDKSAALRDWADSQEVVASLVFTLAIYHEAEPLFNEILSIREQQSEEGDPLVARGLNNLAQLFQATNRLEKAEPLMVRALQIAETSPDKDQPNIAIYLNNLAQLYKATNRLAEAEPLMVLALQIAESFFGKDHPTTSTYISNLAQLFKDTNRLAMAEPLLVRALQIDEASFGSNHPNIARGLHNLASLLQSTNRLAEAEHLLVRALQITEISFGGDHPNVARSLNNLATLFQATNRLVEAEALMVRALQIDEAAFGGNHPSVAIRLNNLAQLFKDTNRLAEAEPLMVRALLIDEASFGRDHPNVAKYLLNLAALLQATNRLAEAEPLVVRALQIDEASFGGDHPNVARGLNNLAQLFQSTSRFAEAEPLLVRALRIDEASFGEDHPRVAIRLSNLGTLFQVTNRLTEAESFLIRALKIDEDSFGGNHPTVATDLNNLAQLYRATDRLTEAEPIIIRALKIDEASFGGDHPNVAIDLNNLAQLFQTTNRLAEAEPLFVRALKINESSFGMDHPEVAGILNNLARLFQTTGRLADAESLMTRAAWIFLQFQASTGHKHPNSDTVIDNYLSLAREMELSDEQIHARLDEVRSGVGLDQALFGALWEKLLTENPARPVRAAVIRGSEDDCGGKTGLGAKVWSWVIGKLRLWTRRNGET